MMEMVVTTGSIRHARFFFCRPDALPVAQLPVSEHSRIRIRSDLEYVVTVDERGVKVAACVCLGLSRFGAT